MVQHIAVIGFLFDLLNVSLDGACELFDPRVDCLTDSP
jgi:hypothetical protein